MKKLNNQSGFIAITELIVVISIVMILMGLAIPTFNSARARARETQAISDMGNIIKPGAEMFKVDVRRYPGKDDGAGYSLMNIPADTGLSSSEQELWHGPYIKSKDIANPSATDWPKDPWGTSYIIAGNGVDLCMVVSFGKNKTADYTYTGVSPTARPSLKTGRFCDQMGDDCGTKDDLGVVVYEAGN